MTYYLTNLLQDAYRSLGRTTTFLATGGSATTVVSTTLKEKYQEEDMEDYYVIISRTTDRLTPEGKYALVTSYDEDTNTITIPTVTAAVGAGDEILLIDAQFPLQEMIDLANKALTSLCGIADLLIISGGVRYKGEHPVLTSYDSVVSNYIHPKLAESALVLEALEWYNSQISGSDVYWMQKLNSAVREYEIALQRHAIDTRWNGKYAYKQAQNSES